MGLDVGDKTIGVALSDELGISAHPVTVIKRIGSIKKEIAELLKIAEEQEVIEIVVGKPFMLDGSVGIQAEKVEFFVEALRRRTRIPVVEFDERLTTMEAERVLISAGQSREKRKEVIDMLAASVLLSAYMEQKSSREKRDESGENLE
jgi:putative Holliday junction resolvase